jgi:hypothetical protein
MDSSANEFGKYFPILFIGLWLLVTSLLGLLSGWYFLMIRYPDCREAPILKLRWQSGTMGLGVGMRGILSLGACPSGLRIGISRIFGLFCRAFFVPWEEITVVRKTYWLFGRTRLHFGSVGSLTISDNIANQFWRSIPGRWPENGEPPIESRGLIFRRAALLWLVSTLFVSAFFIGAPKIISPDAAAPPISVAILFPAIVFGLFILFSTGVN